MEDDEYGGRQVSRQPADERLQRLDPACRRPDHQDNARGRPRFGCHASLPDGCAATSMVSPIGMRENTRTRKGVRVMGRKNVWMYECAGVCVPIAFYRGSFGGAARTRK